MPHEGEIVINIRRSRGDEVTVRTTRSGLESAALEEELKRAFDLPEGMADPLVENLLTTIRKDEDAKAYIESYSGSIKGLEGVAGIVGAPPEPVPPPEPLILIVVVTRRTTLEKPPDTFAHVVSRYITLLEGSYPEGRIVVTGVPDGDEETWLTQEEFVVAARKGTDRLHVVYLDTRSFTYVQTFPESYGYDQIHIIGHGNPKEGLLFDERRFPFNKGASGLGTAAYLFALKPEGKLVVAACYAKDGTMGEWLNETITLDSNRTSRVHLVKGDIKVKYDDYDPKTVEAPKSWEEQHYSMKDIARHIGLLK
jgi:hypothetical protein